MTAPVTRKFAQAGESTVVLLRLSEDGVERGF